MTLVIEPWKLTELTEKRDRYIRTVLADVEKELQYGDDDDIVERAHQRVVKKYAHVTRKDVHRSYLESLDLDTSEINEILSR